MFAVFAGSAVATIVVLTAAVVAVRWWTWRPVMARRVLVQTDADVSFRGVVVSRRGALLVLDDVTITRGSMSHRADGQFVVDRAHVLWMQVS